MFARGRSFTSRCQPLWFLAIYCHEEHGKPVSIYRVRQLRNQILNESRMQPCQPDMRDMRDQQNQKIVLAKT